MFEWDLNSACETGRSDIEPQDLKHLRKGIIDHMMGVLGRYLGWGREVFLELVQL